MLKIGLTGGIGSGKSTAANFFRTLGIDVIDLDQIARDVVRLGSPALQRICQRFGQTVLNKDNSLDRQKLGKIIFNNPSEKSWLESLLHPLIHDRKQQLVQQSKSAYVVIEIPLLAENKRQSDVDRVLVIDCDEQQQIKRAVARGQQTEEQIKKIIALQATRAARKALADDIVENHGTTVELEEKLTSIHEKYLQFSSKL